MAPTRLCAVWLLAVLNSQDTLPAGAAHFALSPVSRAHLLTLPWLASHLDRRRTASEVKVEAACSISAVYSETTPQRSGASRCGQRVGVTRGCFLGGEGALRGLALFLRSLPPWRPVAHAARVCDKRLQLRPGEPGVRCGAGTGPRAQQVQVSWLTAACLPEPEGLWWELEFYLIGCPHRIEGRASFPSYLSRRALPSAFQSCVVMS